MLNKKTLREYFSFSRRDRFAITTMTLLIVGLYFIPYFIDGDQEDFLKPNDLLARAIDSLHQKQAASSKKTDEDFSAPEPTLYHSKNEVFNFDPNTLSVEGWQKLGLSLKTGKTIEKYRSRGGKFYKPEDLQKIWGLPPGFFERVKDHIIITNSDGPEEKQVFEKSSFQRKENKIITVHINQSDTTAFISLPGIGSKLALRIVSFREKLGGFYSVSQIKETYGLADSTFQKIRPFLLEGGEIKKININTVTKEELRKHPYFKWNVVNAIIEYRNQHGNFSNVEELKNIAVIDEVLFSKVMPYLVVND